MKNNSEDYPLQDFSEQILRATIYVANVYNLLRLPNDGNWQVDVKRFVKSL
jgi:hypothetical protein